MVKIPDHVKEAIEEGRVFLTEDRELVKEKVSRKLMPFLEYLPEDYVQEQIDGWTDLIHEDSDGYMYNGDFDMTLANVIPKYAVKTMYHLVQDAKEQVEKLIADAKKDLGK